MISPIYIYFAFRGEEGKTKKHGIVRYDQFRMNLMMNYHNYFSHANQ